MKQQVIMGSLLVILFVLMGCQTAVTAVAPPAIASSPTASSSISLSPTPLPIPTVIAKSPPPLSPSPQPPTAVPTSPPISTLAPSATPTSTPIVPCTSRQLADDDWWAIVTQTYGLSQSYAPPDLVSLNEVLGNDVTLGYPLEVRAFMVEPLVQMIAAMQTAGLQPQLLSGYRSYNAQSLAYSKWASEFPGHVNIISAAPGHSEHQLGTTIDFGSPELPLYTGDPSLQFHTYFYKTSEGIWLLANAHHYGFTLSWPLETFELTGFYYEPWHYRYVGVEMATMLHEQGLSLTEFQLANQPEPCIPDE